MRQKSAVYFDEDIEIAPEIIAAVSHWLNLPKVNLNLEINELENYINASPKQRCSLGTTSERVKELISNNMPPETKVQSFSNRLPGGMNGEPKRQADSLLSLAYQLIAICTKFSAASKQEPLYLHFSLPQGSAPELLRIWKEFLETTGNINTDGGPVTVDELKLYKEKILDYKPNKVVGLALPKRAELIHSTVVTSVVWG